MKIDIEKISSKLLIHEINQFRKERDLHDLNLMEVILEFCEYYKLDCYEVGEKLKKKKIFVNFLREELERNNIIKKDIKTSKIYDWF